MQKKNGSDIPEDSFESLLGALDELEKLGPDDPIPESASNAMRKLLDLIDEENEKFLSGSFAMDPKVMKNVHKAAVLFKRFERHGILRGTEIHADPGIAPASVSAETDGFILTMADKEDFADVLESCGDYEISADLSGHVHISVVFPKLWVKVNHNGTGEADEL